MKFKDKICIVTGGANGIGRCIVESFLKEGAYVAFADVDEAGGKQLLAAHDPARLLFFPGDLTQEEALLRFHRQVIDGFRQADYLINNACFSKGGILSGCSFEDFNYILRLGITAPYLLAKLFLDHFRPEAAIVNIGSTRAWMSQADTESYSAAKGGISALTHALSISLAGKVRVNAISPGWIDTGAYQTTNPTADPGHSLEDKLQHPAGIVGAPSDIAHMVLFLCSPEARFITGENIIIDGGMTKQMIYHNELGWTYTRS